MSISGGKIFARSAPAKLNLMLAVTGTRADGFHEIVSLVAPVPALCDELEMEICAGAPADSLECISAEKAAEFSGTEKFAGTDFARGVPVDASNLVLRAAAAFREIFPAFPHVRFLLKKRIPHGAGLGGGSSDAVAALLLAAEAAGTLFGARAAEICGGNALHALAASLGSDCPLFLAGTPLVMRGRGEITEKLAPAEIAALADKKFLIFKPAFSVSTAEAYGAMKRAAPRFYTPRAEAERRLAAWRADPAGTPIPFFNDMEAPVFRKFVALPAVFRVLRERFGICAHMSGSGSACFAEILPQTDVPAVAACIRECLGDSAFVFCA